MKYASPLLLFVALILGACDPGAIGPGEIPQVCTALVKGYSYNSYDLHSLTHAGPTLVLDLKQHNQIGAALHCPGFKVPKFSRLQLGR